MQPLIWQIDDTSHWHEVTDATLARLPVALRCEHFHSGHAGLLAWQGAASHGGLPDLVLMDFYIGSERGDDVAQALRQVEPAGHHAVIVGFSSVPSASQRIADACGGIALPKVANHAGINPELLAMLRKWLDPAATERPD